MKIAILITDIHSTGGVVTASFNLANALVEKGYEIDIVSCFKSVRAERSYFLNEKVNVQYLDMNMDINKNKIEKQFYFRKEIKSFLKGKNYSVVIGTNAHINIYLASMKGSLNSKIIGCEHGAYNHLPKGWRRITEIFYKRLDKLVLLTEKEIDLYKVKKQNISVIGNICSTENCEKSNLDNKTITMINRIDENKNLLVAIDIFEKVSKRVKDVKLNIYGEAEEDELKKILQRIKELNLQDKVFIKKFQSNIKEVYLNTDIFLLTSKSEGLPMVLLEAASYGIPAVSFDINTGPSDIIIDGETGFLIKPFELEEMTKVLIKLSDNYDYRKKIGNEAKKQSIRYSKEVIVNKWIAVFNEVWGRIC